MHVCKGDDENAFLWKLARGAKLKLSGSSGSFRGTHSKELGPQWRRSLLPGSPLASQSSQSQVVCKVDPQVVGDFTNRRFIRWKKNNITEIALNSRLLKTGSNPLCGEANVEKRVI